MAKKSVREQVQELLDSGQPPDEIRKKGKKWAKAVDELTSKTTPAVPGAVGPHAHTEVREGGDF